MAARIKNIKEYIKEKDSDLLDWIEEHVSDADMFRPPVTFILPEESVRKRIIKSSPPDVGLDILKSYVIPGISLKRYAAFMPNADTLITYADHVLDVKHVDNSGVRVGSAELRTDAIYGNNEESSVYYANGELPTSGESASAVLGSAQHKRRIHGRAESKRAQLCEFVERRYKTYLYKRALFPREMKCVNPYLEFMVSFFMYLKSLQGPDSIYGQYLPYILDVDPIISFYIILEPYFIAKPGSQYMIPDIIIDNYRYSRVYGNIFNQYYQLFANLGYTPSFIDQKTKELVNHQQRLKSAGSEIYKSCEAQYAALFNNTSMLREYPREILVIIGTPQKKMSQDILRCRLPVFYNVFTREGESGDTIHISESTISKEFALFRNHIRTTCYYNVCDIKMREMPVREPVTAHLNFCKSYCFLYSAPTLEEIKNKTHCCHIIYEAYRLSNGDYNRTIGLERDLSVYRQYGQPPPFTLSVEPSLTTAPSSLLPGQ